MEEHKIIVRHVYKNPCPATPEDYSLIPTQTEQAEDSGYQDINTMIARFTRGELCDFGSREENPLADLLDKPIEEIKPILDELAEQSKQDKPNLNDVVSDPHELESAACEQQSESFGNSSEKKAEPSK